MPTYFDSSVVVALLSDEPHSNRAFRLWEGARRRVGSILLAVESEVAARRIAAARPALAADATARLAEIIEEVALKNVDAEVLHLVRSTPDLSRCRSLDAVHLATALHFAERSDEPLVVATFDARMAEVAAAVGLRVLGASAE
jgi:predicted nucleic acid-binding protein